MEADFHVEEATAVVILPAQGEPLYVAIYRQLREQIQAGQLPAGAKLPSKRALASQLAVSVNTVDGAYSQLQSEGFVESRPRSGYYVRPIDALQKLSLARPQPAAPAREADGVQVDFHPGGVAREKFPFSVWQRLLKDALADPASLERTPPQGDPGLRQAVADYLYGARGVQCTADQVVIGAGTDSLLSMLSYILPSRCTVAVENPVYNQAYRLFARMGHPVRPAEIDKQGVRVEPLEALDNVLLYTTPSHQYPLGLSMPMGRRAKLLNWAGRGRFRYIVEDDYDSEFRYDIRPLPSLQSADRNGRVIYLGTFSRSVAPALRVSYMVLPPELLALYEAQYARFSTPVSTLEQLALREFLVRGHFATHLNRMRVYCRSKRKLLVEALAPLAGQMRILGEAAGHHLTLQARNGLTEAELCARALAAGVRVYPISPYFMGRCPYEGKVLLGFGGLSDRQLLAGAAALVRAWQVPPPPCEPVSETV